MHFENISSGNNLKKEKYRKLSKNDRYLIRSSLLVRRIAIAIDSLTLMVVATRTQLVTMVMPARTCDDDGNANDDDNDGR